MSGEGTLADINGVVEDVKILSRPKLWWGSPRSPHPPSHSLCPALDPLWSASRLLEKTTLGACTHQEPGYLGAHPGQVGPQLMTGWWREMKDKFSCLRCGLTLQYWQTWLRLELDLRAHLSLTFPFSCPAPPVPGKIFNKSFAYIAFSGPASGEIWIYQNSQRCTQPMRTLPSTLAHLEGEIVNRGESHLWAGTLDANWFLFFKKEIITWGSFIIPALSLD